MKARIAGWWEDRCFDLKWLIGRRIGHVICTVFGHPPATSWGSHISFALDGTYTHEEGYWCSRCLRTF